MYLQMCAFINQILKQLNLQTLQKDLVKPSRSQHSIQLQLNHDTALLLACTHHKVYLNTHRV